MKLKIGQTYINKKTGKEIVIRRITDDQVFFGRGGRLQVESFVEKYEVKKINNK